MTEPSDTSRRETPSKLNFISSSQTLARALVAIPRGARRSAGASGLAFAVVALVLLSALASPGGLSHTAASSTNPNVVAGSASVSSSQSRGTPALSTPSGGPCSQGQRGGATPAGTAHSAGPSPSSSTGPSPLYNSQVTPYAQFTGPYGYVAAGAALRDQGYGKINLTWPGTSPLVAAYMIWSFINNSVPPDYATLNGVNITGTWTAYATPSPCWSPTYIYTFVADVTSAVVNGVNNLTGFPSPTTNGYDPWNQSLSGLLDEGASLVAIYDNMTTAYDQQVTVYTGALTSGGQTITEQLNYSTTNSTQAKTTYIIADGQLPGNEAFWSGTLVDSDAFPGSDPHQSPYKWSYGNLSDTKTYNVNVNLSSNNTTAAAFPTQGDCFTWVGQVLSVGVPAARGPYDVRFQEQGLPNGQVWNITTHGSSNNSTVVKGSSSVNFLLGNGSYSYSVKAIPGYAAASPGSYKVKGGPVYLRVLFHQLLYTLRFNETGLPYGAVWSVTLTNQSQAVSETLSFYAPEEIEFNQSNGTYNFTDSEQGLYLAEPASGSLTLSGTSMNQTIVFVPPPLFNVTIQENGLPSGTLWGASVDSNWGAFSNQTTTPSYSLLLPNTTAATDSLTPNVVTGYHAPNYLYFGVYGAAFTIDVNYSALFTVYFNETGLSSGTLWYVLLDTPVGELESEATGASITFSAVNGTSNFTVVPVWGYIATPATGSVTIDGASASQAIVFSSAPTYTLTFSETGLAPGTHWSIQLTLPNDSSLVHGSTGSSVVFYEPNGSYGFTVLPVTGYSPSPGYGYFSVVGVSVNESVVFTELFEVVFTEQGLPSGVYWAAYLGSYYNATASTTNDLWVPNATYEFTVYPTDGYTPTPATGSIVVDGANQFQTIVFSSTAYPTFAITFSESGLPALTNWSVDLNGYTEETSGASLAFTEANGTFGFTVIGPVGYTASPASNSVVVSGAPVNQPIAFSVSTGLYLVQFTESNLPNGATWYVNISGQPGLSAVVSGSVGTVLSISLANDSYSFTAASNQTGWTTTAGGPFEVSGAAVNEGVPFTGPTHPISRYLVTFTESGLPNGATWYANISGQSGLSATVSGSTGTQLTVSLENASYTFTVATNWKNWTTTTASGSFTVSGSTPTVTVAFKSTSTGTIPPTTSAGTSSSFPWLWVALVIGLAALFLLFFMAYRRRKKDEPTPAPPPAGSIPPPPTKQP